MARIVNWRGNDLLKACRDRAFQGLLEAGKVLQQFYFNMLGASNAGGTRPSYPGQAPRMGTGIGRTAIKRVGYHAMGMVNLVMMKPGHHLLMLDAGTEPHTIRAKSGKLMIWFRPKPFRPPTQREIDDLGLKQIGGRWYMFRDEVKHPGTTEASGPGGGRAGSSPWIERGLQMAKPFMAAAFGRKVI